MVRVPGFYAGPYGNGLYGLKTSIAPYNVKDVADDHDVERRSFNSNWPNVALFKLAGFAAGIWTTRRYQLQTALNPVTGLYQYRSSTSAWVLETPIQVATGLNYMPVWEERLYDPALARVYDDYVYGNTPATTVSFSGARSYFSGPGLTPNTLWFEPFSNVTITGQTGTTPDGYPMVHAFNVNYNADGAPPYPPYPDYPPYPGNTAMGCLYAVYRNKAGDVS